MTIPLTKLYVPISCSLCNTEANGRRAVNGGARLPKGWKRHQDSNKPICEKCWEGKYGKKPIAIVMPIRGVEGCKFDDFSYLINIYGAEISRCKVWLFRYYFKNDLGLEVGTKFKLLPLEINQKSLLTLSVQAAKIHFPLLRHVEIATCAVNVFKKYKHDRIAILRGTRWSRGYFNPQPIPLIKDNQWKDLKFGNETTKINGGDHNYRVKIRIGHGNAKDLNRNLKLANTWITLKLSSNLRFKYQLVQLDKIVNKIYIPTQFQILRRPNTSTSKHTKNHRIFLKMICWVPKENNVSNGPTTTSESNSTTSQ